MDEIIIWFKVFPQHVIVVSVELEELFVVVYVALEGEYSLEITHPVQLLTRFK